MIVYASEVFMSLITYWSASWYNIIIIHIISETNLICPTRLPPHYRNDELEKVIADHKDGMELNLRNRRLTHKDMEIVAYYVLRNNKVSQILFGFVISEINRILTYDFFLRKRYTCSIYAYIHRATTRSIINSFLL